MEASMQDGKRCTKCGKLKPEAEYYKDKRASDGLHSSCKDCHRALTRDNMRKKREDAAYREWEREYLKQFKRSDHMTPEERRAYAREWYYKNHEHAKRYAREYMRKRRSAAKDDE